MGKTLSLDPLCAERRRVREGKRGMPWERKKEKKKERKERRRRKGGRKRESEKKGRLSIGVLIENQRYVKHTPKPFSSKSKHISVSGAYRTRRQPTLVALHGRERAVPRPSAPPCRASAPGAAATAAGWPRTAAGLGPRCSAEVRGHRASRCSVRLLGMKLAALAWGKHVLDGR